MALVSIPSLLCFPEIPLMADMFNGAGSSSYTLDALGEKIAVIFRAPKTGTLAKIWFLVGSITTATDLKISFQDVDLATGDPDGVVDQYRVVAPAPQNTWKQTGLITSDGTDTGTKRGVTIGDLLAAVIEFDLAAGNLGIRMIGNVNRTGYRDNCYWDKYLTGAWVRVYTEAPFFAVEYDDGSTAPVLGAYVMSATTGTGLTVAAGAEGGTRGKVPFKCRTKGLWIALGHGASTSFEVRLYASDMTTILGSVAQDSDVGTGKGNTYGNVGAYHFSSPVGLNPNDVLYVCVTPTGGSLNIPESPIASTTLWDAAMRSSDWYKVTRATAGSGAFTEGTNNIIWAGLILDQLDDGAGGAGGLLVHPGMSGGMRG